MGAGGQETIPGDGHILVDGAEFSNIGKGTDDDILGVRQAQAAADGYRTRDIRITQEPLEDRATEAEEVPHSTKEAGAAGEIAVEVLLEAQFCKQQLCPPSIETQATINLPIPANQMKQT